MNDLVAFLRARYDERERVARAAAHGVSGRWVQPSGRGSVGYGAGKDDWPEGSSNGVVVYDEGAPTPEQAEHIALNDPAYVLADIAAKRQVIDLALSWRHRVVEDCYYTCPAATEERDGGECCNENLTGTRCGCGVDQRRLVVLGLLALPFAGHPDYRDEWRR